MPDPIKPAVPASTASALADPLADLIKAKAEAAAKVKLLRMEAAKKLIEAEKAKQEAEAILYADWKEGNHEVTRKVKIPYANFASGAQPKINGRELAGYVDMTYDAFRGMMHQLSYRAEQENHAKNGYFKGVGIMNVLTNTIRLVDAWDPKSEGLAGVDYKST